MSQPEIKYLKDYKPSNYLINETHLTFNLDESKTVVTADLHITKNPANNESNSLILDGVDLKLLSIKINNKDLSKSDFNVNNNQLTIYKVPENFVLNTVVEINPSANTSLEGLYKSGEVFCTQCEATGFRKITYYLDRPDVMSSYTVKIIANKQKYPVILSNGDKVDSGDISDTLQYIFQVFFLKYILLLVFGYLLRSLIYQKLLEKLLAPLLSRLFSFHQVIVNYIPHLI